MKADRAGFDEQDEAAPVDMLAAMFAAHGWDHDFVSDEEITAEIPGSWTTYQLRGIWRAEDKVLQLLCLPDIRVPDDKLRTAHELLALVNEQLWLGHFDIWSQGSVLLYRHGLLLGEGGTLGVEMAQLAVDSALSECDRFYPAFQFVLWGDKSAAEALDAALVDPAGEA